MAGAFLTPATVSQRSLQQIGLATLEVRHPFHQPIETAVDPLNDMVHIISQCRIIQLLRMSENPAGGMHARFIVLTDQAGPFQLGSGNPELMVHPTGKARENIPASHLYGA